jgi:hypothetical protein
MLLGGGYFTEVSKQSRELEKCAIKPVVLAPK